MSLEEAVNVLNSEKHRTASDWQVVDMPRGGPLFVVSLSLMVAFSPWEAEVIAEAYREIVRKRG